LGKLPALQWYPGDWRKDVGIQSLSYHDRGVWFEMLMLMHESPVRGKLMIGGKAASEDLIAGVLHLDIETFRGTVTTLLDRGICDRDSRTGALMNRRMVRDEEGRSRNRRKLEKWRKDKKIKGNGNQKETPDVTPKKPLPSSSSSSSSSSSTSVCNNTPPPPVAALDHIDISRRVGEECQITSTTALREIQEQAKLDLAAGRIADDIAAELTASIRFYREEKPKLRITWGLEKFIGEGHWRDPRGWPRKESTTGKDVYQRFMESDA
jgi:hypothetical protein